MPLRYNLALAYSNANLTQDALMACREILDRDPNYVDALVLRVGTLRQLGRFDEARESVARLRSIAPRSYDAVSQLALDQAHDLSEEEAADIEAVAAAPGLAADRRATLLFTLARREQMRGNHDAAFAFLTKEVHLISLFKS